PATSHISPLPLHDALPISITTQRPDGTPLVLRWGTQVDVRPIRQTSADQLADQGGELSDAQLAGYIAKYATKGTNISEGADKPRSEEHTSELQSRFDLVCR